MKLVISDAHEGLKAASTKVLNATSQRCRVHFMRNALAHVGTKQRQMVAAVIRTAFTQETQKAAPTEWRAVTDRLRGRFEGDAHTIADAKSAKQIATAAGRIGAERVIMKHECHAIGTCILAAKMSSLAHLFCGHLDDRFRRGVQKRPIIGT